jgi:hypothetical protein
MCSHPRIMDYLKDIIPPESHGKFYPFKKHLLRKEMYFKLITTLSFPCQYKISVIIIALQERGFYSCIY